ncbi:MAG: glycosyltransferase [Oscillospiraceae bacterium]|nr:glycosyltransferase [Oscillospiraceae bacterium]
MSDNVHYGIDRIRIFRSNTEEYSYSVFIMGCCLSREYTEPDIHVKINGNPTSVRCVYSRRYVSERTEDGTGIRSIPVFSIMFDWTSQLERIELFSETENGNIRFFEINKKLIDGITEYTSIDLNIDEISLTEPTCYVRGWIRHIAGKELDIELTDEKGNAYPAIINRNCRGDLVLAGMADESNDLGFDISFPYKAGEQLSIRASADDSESLTVPLETKQRITKTKLYRAYACVSGMGLLNAVRYYSDSKKITGHSEPDKSQCEQCKKLTCPHNRNFAVPYYHSWFSEHSPDEDELQKQRKTKFTYNPLISIIVPCYNTPLDYLQDMIGSVVNQTYSGWELCIADASDNGETNWMLGKYAEQYPGKVKVVKLTKNLGISENTNKALELAGGEYAAMLDHDDTITPDALFRIVSELQNEHYDVIYSDEDKLIEDTGIYDDPHFKPDFDPELLRTNNYICHLFCAKLDLIRKVGCYRSEYNGSQDYDMILRCTENGENICHIPRVLYHWRMHKGSTAEDPESKMYCYLAGEKAIRDHLARKGIDAEVSMMKKPLYGRYIVKYRLRSRPKVSILIPNCDEKETLEMCIKSLYEINDYDNFEVIVIENNSRKKETFEYYRKLEREYDNLRIVIWNGTEFNYSSINNFGEKYATGEYLLLLNNDTSMITPDALSDMLSICEREEVGIVGAKLLYPDNSIQHAGVILGLGGIAGHAFSHVPDSAYGYMCRARLSCCCSAVTAACLLMSRKLYEDIGGLNETAFKVAFNDVDLCLRVRKRGYLIVWDAHSYWYHYESKTRGLDTDPDKLKRFEDEKKRFAVIWKKLLEKGDPYYNPNWDLRYDSYTTFIK